MAARRSGSLSGPPRQFGAQLVALGGQLRGDVVIDGVEQFAGVRVGCADGGGGNDDAGEAVAPAAQVFPQEFDAGQGFVLEGAGGEASGEVGLAGEGLLAGAAGLDGAADRAGVAEGAGKGSARIGRRPAAP